MVEQDSKQEEVLDIIKHIEINPASTQRTLSDRLGISLGKTNYLLNALIKKGLVKVENFSIRPGKIGKINYYLTRRGIEEKMRLMRHFLKQKEQEYHRFKHEWERLSGLPAKRVGENI